MCTVFPKFLDIQTFFFYIFDACKGSLAGYKILLAFLSLNFLKILYHIALFCTELLRTLMPVLFSYLYK